MSIDIAPAVEELRRRGSTLAVAPGEDGWDIARQAFNLSLDQRPAFVALPTGEDDVVAVMELAAAHGLRVAAQTTGHNAAPISSLEDTVLLRTTALAGAEVDAGARRARARGGARWREVSAPAAAAGLYPLAGSSPGVGVAGYTLGGGLSFLGRCHGLACNSVIAYELVTADGRRVRVSAEEDPELFWALRGGGGSFGVVTAVELELFEIPELYAGVLFFPFERASEVLHAWREWLPSLPEETTSVGRLLQFPPLEEIPEPVRGKSFAVVQMIHLGPESEGADLIAPLRELGPAMDTVAAVGPEMLMDIHMDPPDPVPYTSGHQLLDGLSPEALDRMLEVAGPGSGSTLVSVELRQTGGALARSETGSGVLSQLPGAFAGFAVGALMEPSWLEPTEERLAALTEALSAHDCGSYFNFTESRIDPATLYDAEAYARLRAVKSAWDPENRILANHQIPTA